MTEAGQGGLIKEGSPTSHSTMKLEDNEERKKEEEERKYRDGNFTQNH